MIVADDAAFTPATSKVMMAGFEFDDAAPDSIDEGDAGAARMSANRNIYTQIRDAAGNERGVNVNASNQLAIAGPVTVASGGIASGAIASGAIASGAVASGAVASGAFASGSIAAGAIAAGATSFVALEDDASANLDAGVKCMAVQKATPADTAADGDYMMLQMSAGRLWTATNINQVGGTATDTNSGNKSAGTLRVVLATDQPALTNKLLVTPDAGATVQDIPATSGGLSSSSFLSTGAVQTTEVKGSAGQVYSIEFFNITSTPVYVRLYNQTGAPASTDGANIKWRGIVPGNTAGGGFVVRWEKGLACSTGIGFRCTSLIADNDTTVLVANSVIGNIEYK